MFSFVYGGIDFAHKLDAASAPMEDFYKHVHTFNEIIFFVDGEVEYTVESEIRVLQPGDIIFIAPGKYHFATVNNNVGYERYVLKFPSSVLPDFLVERVRKMSPFFDSSKEQANVFSRFDFYNDFGDYSEDELKAVFVADVIKLLIALSKAPSAAPNRINAVIADIITYIDENIHTNLSLDELSELFHFSKSYLSNEFKRAMKISIMQYVRMKKIIAAHQLILQGEKKSRVAEQFGFDNYSTFYRQYMKLLQGDALEMSPERSSKST